MHSGTVVLIEADPLARRAISGELAPLAEVTRVVEAGDLLSGVELVRRERPAAVVLELEPLQPNPVEPLIRLLAAVPDAAVLVFSMFDEEETEIAAIRAGARAFVGKQGGLGALLPPLLAVMRGESAVSRRLTMKIIRVLREAPESGRGMRPVRSKLTNREWEILDLIGTGHSTREIAEQLVVTEDTVYSHVKNSMRKLRVHTRAEAVEQMGQELRGEE